jgi:hypothetical protein
MIAHGIKSSPRHLAGALLGCTLWFTMAFVPSLATGAEERVDTQRALRSLPKTTWYDSQRQEYTPPRVAAEKDTTIRMEGWKAANTKSHNWQFWDWLKGLQLGQFFAGLGEFLSRAMLVLLVISLLGVAVTLLYYALRDYLPRAYPQKKIKRAIEIDPARLEDLPFDVHAAGGDPLAEARSLYESGRYNEAIVYLYGYMLLALDNARRIHLIKGKTNRMYLRELRRDPSRLRSIMEMTMLAFEQVYFGKRLLSAEHFGILWGHLDEFHALLANPANVADESGSEVAPA